jgi:hypothetical protein
VDALTLAQVQARFQERNINNRFLTAQFQQVMVAKGYCELSMDQFDSSKDYSAATLYLGANGKLTTVGPGPLIPSGKVLAIPADTGTAQGAMLRVSFLIG